MRRGIKRFFGVSLTTDITVVFFVRRIQCEEGIRQNDHDEKGVPMPIKLIRLMDADCKKCGTLPYVLSLTFKRR